MTLSSFSERRQVELYAPLDLTWTFWTQGSEARWSTAIPVDRSMLVHRVEATVLPCAGAERGDLIRWVRVTLHDDGADRRFFDRYLDRLVGGDVLARVRKLEERVHLLENPDRLEAMRRLGADLEPDVELDACSLAPPYYLDRGARLSARLMSEVTLNHPASRTEVKVRLSIMGIEKVGRL